MIVMLVSSFFGWWYGAGYKDLIRRIGSNMDRLADQFSIARLISTLFAPFRQIDAGGVIASAPANIKLKVWSDRMFSRLFGAFIRFFTIIIGLVALLLAGFFGLVRLLIWPIIPMLPILGIIMTISGWMPWA